MTKFSLFRLKNAMLFANGIPNLIGVSIVLFLAQRIGISTSPAVAQLGDRINMLFIPCSFVLPITLMLLYEEPIRRYVNLTYRGRN